MYRLGNSDILGTLIDIVKKPESKYPTGSSSLNYTLTHSFPINTFSSP